MSNKVPYIFVSLLVYVIANQLLILPKCQAMDKRQSLETPPAAIIENNTIYENGRAGLRIRGTTPVEINKCNLYKNGRTGLNIEYQANVRVKNSTIHHNELGGISINNADRVEIEKNRIHQNGKAGVRIRKDTRKQDSASTVTVNNNTIFLNKAGGVHTVPTADAQVQLTVTNNTINGNKRGGIRVENNTHLTASQNRIFDNGTAGIASYAADGTPPFLNLYQNRIYFNKGGGIHVASGVTGSFGISNNLIYNNHRAGISCGLWKDKEENLVNIRIIHNTIVSNGSNELGAGIRNDSDGEVLIYNNIIAYNFTSGILTNRCKDASYNLLFANWATSSFDEASDKYIVQTERIQYSGCSGQGKGDLITAPLFMDPDNYNFTLRKDSPARGAAKPATSPLFSTFANDIGVVSPFVGKHKMESSSIQESKKD